MQSTEILTLESIQIPRFREAYEELLPVISTLPDPSHLPIDIDIPSLVARTLSFWPKLYAEKPRVARTSSPSDLEDFERVRSYALALGHAHSLYVTTAASLTDCLSIPKQARVLCREFVDFADETEPDMERLTAVALAVALAQRLPSCPDPFLTCRAQHLIDKLEVFSEQCGSLQDQLFLANRHQNVLLGLLIETFDRLVSLVVGARNGKSADLAPLPSVF